MWTFENRHYFACLSPKRNNIWELIGNVILLPPNMNIHPYIGRSWYCLTLYLASNIRYLLASLSHTQLIFSIFVRLFHKTSSSICNFMEDHVIPTLNYFSRFILLCLMQHHMSTLGWDIGSILYLCADSLGAELMSHLMYNFIYHTSCLVHIVSSIITAVKIPEGSAL